MTTITPTKEQLENRRKWVAALRSGAYRQAKAVLYDGAGYCCLGIACVALGLLPDKERHFDTFSALLPPSIAKRLGFGESWLEGKLDKPVAGEGCLSSLNDLAGYTFAQIADVIEEQFIKPFETAATS